MGQTDSKFRGHLEGGRFIMTLNERVFEQPMLFVRHGLQGGQYQVQWSKVGGHLVLEAPPVNSLAGVEIPQGVNGTSPILGRFPILPSGQDSSFVQVDLTDFILQAPISWQRNLPKSVDRKRSYIEGVCNLENEVVIGTKSTVIQKGKDISSDVDFSFYVLPKPIRPRLFDHRMGFFSEDILDVLNHRPKPAVASIMRWHLEKKNKDLKLSEPLRSIVFYLDPSTPEKWKPYIRAGIMEWQPAFESAGFKNALEVREFGPKDSLFPENAMARSVIRWEAEDSVRKERHSSSTVSKIIDFRTGEILKADIIIGSIEDLSDRYFVRCSPMDPRAQVYPFPDDLMGELIQYVTAHEAGHAFGMKDANYGEYAYPFEKMRDSHWLKEMGHTPSIMGYARHNYVVQPEDRIPPSLLIQKVGPMDHYQIQWGYQEIQDVEMPKDELPTLEALVLQQDSVPWYRYNLNQYEKIGPATANNVMDNDNPIESTRLGLKNLERVMEILDRMYRKESLDRSILKNSYYDALELWYAEMQHVLSLIGGYSIQYKSIGQQGAIYRPIDRTDQEEALYFFMQQAITPPDWLANPNFLVDLRFSTHPDELLGYQQKLVQKLFDPHRLKRLEWMEEALGYEGIIEQFLMKFQSTLFRLTDTRDRRSLALQKEFITLMVKVAQEEMEQSTTLANFGYSEMTKGLFMKALISLQSDLKLALDSDIDDNDIGHLKLCLRELKKVTIVK
ncbi:zinc-dependent metalloprotease [Flagellimonas olearia]|uniref:DUF5117 domain-containing protein n=1 Tax=Flagellimonas olearia TaxID=552546 RepID=A0A444VHY7_9FLAO|nr:zinc-dependent metalloprotease [Allomuricauda olearia]RYC50369.1 hypothetical protein DN53_05445 [Allomuricauda olearia]